MSVINKFPSDLVDAYPRNGAAPVGQKRQLNSHQGYDWFGAVVRRKGILIFVACLSGVLGYFYNIRQPKVYESSLKLMIWTQSPPTMVNGETIVQPVSTGKHQNLLQSELVLAKAVNDGNFRELKTFADQPEPLPMLRGMISATPVKSDNNYYYSAEDTLLLKARGPDPNDLPSILTDVVASYQEIISEDAAAIGKSSVELIEKLQARISDEKTTSENRYFELIRKLGISPDPLTGQFINPHYARLEELKTLQSERDREYREVSERIDSIRDLQKLPLDRRTELLKVVAIEAAKYLSLDAKQEKAESPTKTFDDRKELIDSLNTRIIALQTMISELNRKSQKFASALGLRHPSVTTIATDIASASSQLATLIEQRQRLQDELTAEYERAVAGEGQATTASSIAITNFERDLIVIYVASLEREASRLSNSVDAVRGEFEEVETKANALRSEIDELNLLSSDIEQKDHVIREILDRLSQLTVIASNHTFTKVRIIDSPGTGYQVEPRLMNTLFMAIFGGGLIGFGLIVLLDWSDLSFRSPGEIQEKLGVPVVARIPKVARRGKKASAVGDGLIMLKKPQSAVAEAYRSLRTAMLFTAKQHDCKVFLVTSPSAGDGKSTTSTNLALSFAQGGYRTVIVDADLRRPRCHVYLGVEPTPGLKDYSKASNKMQAIVRSSALHQNLSFVSAGGHLSNPSEFLDSSQFEELLDHLKSHFDFVIIDSPPVLPVADAVGLSSMCDAVLVVLRIRKGVVLSSCKAMDMLRSVKANVLGVVVNSVDRASHYSDYGKYGYNGYGGYNYYARRYHDKQNAKYYDSAVETEEG